jgi:hypothetical protein
VCDGNKAIKNKKAIITFESFEYDIVAGVDDAAPFELSKA